MKNVINYYSRLLLACLILFLSSNFGLGQGMSEELQEKLNQVIEAEGIPGATLAIYFEDGNQISLATGFTDKEKNEKMPVGGQMLLGSTGKTFMTAVFLQLVTENKIHLEAKLLDYFPKEKWMLKLPEAEKLTIRMLLNHRTGMPRYVFQEEFLAEMKKNPTRKFTPKERLEYVLNKPPVHKAGEGWGYSDTNYILLGMVIEKVSGESFYELLKNRILIPHQLSHTYPSIQQKLPGLVQGHIGANNFFSMPKKVIQKGKYAINPQFEWTGGGLVSNVEDLAKWMYLLHSGHLITPVMHKEMVSSVDFRTGKPSASGYGFANFLWQNPDGISYGHSGMMPGYLTQIEYFPAKNYAIAFQVNSDDRLSRSLHQVLLNFEKIVNENLQNEAEEAIYQNFKEQEYCWNQHDIFCYMKAYWQSDSVKTVSRVGVTYGIEKIRNSYRESYRPEKMGNLHFDQVELTKLSQTHYAVTGRFNLTFSENDRNRQGWFSVIMKKIDGKWLMISDHSS